MSIFSSAKKQARRANSMSKEQMAHKADLDWKGWKQRAEYLQDKLGPMGSPWLKESGMAVADNFNDSWGNISNRLNTQDIFNTSLAQTGESMADANRAYSQTAGDIFGGGYDRRTDSLLSGQIDARNARTQGLLGDITNRLSGGGAGALYGSQASDQGGGTGFRTAFNPMAANALFKASNAIGAAEEKNYGDLLTDNTTRMRQKLAAMPLIGQHEDDTLARLSGGKAVRASFAPTTEFMNAAKPMRIELG